MSALPSKFFGNRTSGRTSVVTTVIRVLTGVLFVPVGALKLTNLGLTTSQFVADGFPDSPVIPTLVGLLEVVGGLMLILGLGTRLAALGLGVLMVGATIVNLSVMPAAATATVVLLAFAVYLLWAGPGAAALDNRVGARLSVAGS